MPTLQELIDQLSEQPDNLEVLASIRQQATQLQSQVEQSNTKIETLTEQNTKLFKMVSVPEKVSTPPEEKQQQEEEVNPSELLLEIMKKAR